jgi:hypothetical protein
MTVQAAGTTTKFSSVALAIALFLSSEGFRMVSGWMK